MHAWSYIWISNHLDMFMYCQLSLTQKIKAPLVIIINGRPLLMHNFLNKPRNTQRTTFHNWLDHCYDRDVWFVEKENTTPYIYYAIISVLVSIYAHWQEIGNQNNTSPVLFQEIKNIQINLSTNVHITWLDKLSH